MNLDQIVAHLNSELGHSDITDYPNALNGLQVGNPGDVNRVAVAVDACEAVIEEAARQSADLLIVHHGLFWSGLQPVTGAAYRKMRRLMESDLAVYSAHLPLDAHASLGNNSRLCDALEIPRGEREPFLEIGWKGVVEASREVLVARIGQIVGGRVHLAPGGPVQTRMVGVVTGGAGGDIFKAAAEGVDTFITGEGPHWSYTAAEELGINLIYAGHYATETFGVKALGRHLEERFGLPWEFIDHPTGL